MTAFVDGELSPSEAADARSHLLQCHECRRAVMLERAALRRTAAAGCGVQASPELTARLLALSGGLAPTRPSRRPKLPLLLTGTTAVVGLFMITLFMLGAPRADQTPNSFMAVADSATGAPIATSSILNMRDTARWSMPSGIAVQRVGIIETDGVSTLAAVVLVSGQPVHLVERPGRLDSDVEALESLSINGHIVYEVEGWYLLESGECVVAVSADNPDAAADLIGELPGPAEVGVVDRISNGWHQLVG